MAGMSCQFEWDPGCSCCLLNSITWEKLAKADPSLQLEPAPQVITANGQPMNVIGKLSHSITLPNNVSYHRQFIVVNDIAADGFIGSDLMQAAFAISDHAHDPKWQKRFSMAQKSFSMAQTICGRQRVWKMIQSQGDFGLPRLMPTLKRFCYKSLATLKNSCYKHGRISINTPQHLQSFYHSFSSLTQN